MQNSGSQNSSSGNSAQVAGSFFKIAFDMVVRACSGVLFFHRAAWKTSAEPIIHFLNLPPGETQEKMTVAWKDTMQAQLIAVLMTSALVGSLISGGCAWPQLANSQDNKTSTVLALWYSSLLLAVTATSAATQQIVALSRLTSHPDSGQRIRNMLCLGTKKGDKFVPSKWQTFLWQVPVSLLSTSLYLFVTGLCCLVYLEVSTTGSDIKIVVIFSIVAAFSLGNWLVSSAGLYLWIDKASKSPKAYVSAT